MTTEEINAALPAIIDGTAEDEDGIGARLFRTATRLFNAGAVDWTKYTPESAARLLLAVALAEAADNLRIAEINNVRFVHDFKNLCRF